MHPYPSPEPKIHDSWFTLNIQTDGGDRFDDVAIFAPKNVTFRVWVPWRRSMWRWKEGQGSKCNQNLDNFSYTFDWTKDLHGACITLTIGSVKNLVLSNTISLESSLNDAWVDFWNMGIAECFGKCPADLIPSRRKMILVKLKTCKIFV